MEYACNVAVKKECNGACNLNVMKCFKRAFLQNIFAKLFYQFIKKCSSSLWKTENELQNDVRDICYFQHELLQELSIKTRLRLLILQYVFNSFCASLLYPL